MNAAIQSSLTTEPRFNRLPEQVQKALILVRNQNLTYLSDSKLLKLAELCLRHEKAGDSGCILEAGCALGGSAIVLAAAKSKSRALRIYDVFGMIPPPSEKDDADVHKRYQTIASGASRGIGGNRYYGYESNLYDKVIQNLMDAGYPPAENAITPIKGLLQDTLVVDEPVAFAHIDVDWYDPVYVCTERIAPKLIPGGTIVFDDYLDWSGCKKAVDAYFAKRKDEFDFDVCDGSLSVRKKN